MILRQLIRFYTGTAAVLPAVAIAVLLSACGGQKYSCGNPSSGHCYGVVSWSGTPTGFSMEETVVALTGGDIFIDDEGWLIDYFAPGDPLSGAYWVETGEWNEGFGTDYFWASNTANGGFMSYDLGPVSSSDINSGNWVAFTISQDPNTSSQWNVTISRAGTGTLLYSAQSTGNVMTPNTILEGQELAGQQNAQAPLAFFSQNAIIQGSTTTIQTTDGKVEADHPPNAGWFGTLTPSQTNNGGMFFTDCC